MLNKEYNASRSKSTPPIQVQALSKSFGKQRVLKEINLEVEHGEKVLSSGAAALAKVFCSS